MSKRLLAVATILFAVAARQGYAQSPESAALTPELLPPGWSSPTPAYRGGADEHGGRGGGSAGHLTARSDRPGGFGTLQQFVKANYYRGKRVRLTAFIRTKDIPLTGFIGAGLWMRVDGEGATQAFDNTQQRRLNGTRDWTSQQIVLEVPEDALSLNFGMLMDGPGEAWVDDIVLEVVSRTVPVTSQFVGEPDKTKLGAQLGAAARLPLAPFNMDFEQRAGVVAGMSPEPAPTAWTVGSSRATYRVGVDTRVFHSGESSGHITAMPEPDTADAGFISQSVRADRYRGKRVRLSAYLRTRVERNTLGGVVLNMSVSDGAGVAAFDAATDRAITGTTDWKKYEIVLDIPQEALGISIHFSLRGAGEAWIDDVTLEEVGPKVRVTSAAMPAMSPAPQGGLPAAYFDLFPLAPDNLNFEAVR